MVDLLAGSVDAQIASTLLQEGGTGSCWRCSASARAVVTVALYPRVVTADIRGDG